MTTEQTHKVVIVVIDDDDSIREGCRQILEEEQYRVITAEDGRRGLWLVEQERPNVVLVDLKMPGMSGMEVLERIRDTHPGIVTIVITGYGTIDSSVAAMKLGASDYLCKPFDDKSLLAAIGSAVANKGLEGGQSQAGLARAAWTPNPQVVIAVLERAHRDSRFVTRLTEEGSRALEGYELSSQEKAALISGDLRWIEGHVGRLTEAQKSWLYFRLEQERW